MSKILIIGAGKIGRTCAELLAETGDYRVTLADAKGKAAEDGFPVVPLDATDKAALGDALKDHDMVLSAAPYSLSVPVAKAAIEAGVHYFDLTEDVRATKDMMALAKTAESAVVPQCGLAPGFVAIAGFGLAQLFDAVREIKLRVGALPQFPSNAFKYNLTWSTEGLVNEYCHPCEALEDGRMIEVPALEGLEHLTIGGAGYEAFNTSGGLGTLCDTLEGKVENLTYKSIRYPGHNAIMKALIRDLRMGTEENRPLLCRLMDEALPLTPQDVVIIVVEVAGWRGGQLVQESYANNIFARPNAKRHMTAIQLTTASSVCAVIDLFRTGHLPQSGFVRQEQVALDAFLNNRFGSVYAIDERANAV